MFLEDLAVELQIAIPVTVDAVDGAVFVLDIDCAVS
jgi:hypothetical protein